MGKCVVKDCDYRSQKDNKACSITFHRVPKDPVRREKWMKIFQLLRKETDWIPTKTTRICSKHFRNEDKIGPTSDNGRVYLSDEAVPIVEESKLGEQIENIDVDKNVETDEEIAEIFETPRKHKMRKNINRLKFVSKRLIKIKTLSQKNRTLEAKNKKLIDVIKELKEKQILSEEEEI